MQFEEKYLDYFIYTTFVRDCNLNGKRNDAAAAAGWCNIKAHKFPRSKCMYCACLLNIYLYLLPLVVHKACTGT